MCSGRLGKVGRTLLCTFLYFVALGTGIANGGRDDIEAKGSTEEPPATGAHAALLG